VRSTGTRSSVSSSSDSVTRYPPPPSCSFPPERRDGGGCCVFGVVGGVHGCFVFFWVLFFFLGISPSFSHEILQPVPPNLDRVTFRCWSRCGIWYSLVLSLCLVTWCASRPPRRRFSPQNLRSPPKPSDLTFQLLPPPQFPLLVYPRSPCPTARSLCGAGSSFPGRKELFIDRSLRTYPV